MAVRLKKRCKTPFCKNLHTNISGYCDECEKKYQDLHRTTNHKEYREGADKRGYDHQWQVFAKKYLEMHPTCAICGKPAEVVDHKGMTADMMMDIYGHFIYDEKLYQPLCRSCNAKKGNREDKDMRQAFEKEKAELDALMKL